MSVLDKLIAQWARCGGDRCKRRRCPRCRRGEAVTARRQREARS